MQVASENCPRGYIWVESERSCVPIWAFSKRISITEAVLLALNAALIGIIYILITRPQGQSSADISSKKKADDGGKVKGSE